MLSALIVFLSEDDALWLKYFAEINITHNTVVLTVLHSFILQLTKRNDKKIIISYNPKISALNHQHNKRLSVLSIKKILPFLS